MKKRIDLMPKEDIFIDGILDELYSLHWVKIPATKKIKVNLDSYPVYRQGRTYDISFDIVPSVVNGRLEVVHDIIAPIAKRIKTEYDKMVAATKIENSPMLINEVRNGDGYECFHALGDLILERLELDTETMAIDVFFGS